VEPLPVAGDLQRDFFYRGLRACRRISAYIRVSALRSRYGRFARLTLGGKTSMAPKPFLGLRALADNGDLK
jgi:hypothetical protein